MSYSRFGSGTTSHSNFITTGSDLILAGDTEFNASAQFDSFTRVSFNNASAFVVDDGSFNDPIFLVDTTASMSNSGITIAAGPTQTGALFRIESSGGSLLSKFSADGGLVIDIASTSALLLSNGSSVSAERFRFDTLSGKFDIVNSVSSSALAFEIFGAASISGDLVLGSPASTSDFYNRNIEGSGILAYGAICADDALDTTDDCIDAARVPGTVYGISSSFTVDDIAENFPTRDAKLDSGHLVALDFQSIPSSSAFNSPYESEFVKRASSSERATLMGVVSTKPGVLLGGWGQNNDPRAVKQVAIALAGRVPVKVNLENGNIIAGDPITISSTPGVGMKASSAGRVIGFALEGYSTTVENKRGKGSGRNGSDEPLSRVELVKGASTSGEFEILVYINTTHFTPGQESSLQTKNVIGEFTDYGNALSEIVNAPLYKFNYKNGAHNNEEFVGIITDYSPTFGMDRSSKYIGGENFNELTAFGYTFAAIKELYRKIEGANIGMSMASSNAGFSGPGEIISMNQITSSVASQSSDLRIAIVDDKLVLMPKTGISTIILKALEQVIIDAPVNLVRNIWTKGSIIAEGIKKTYYSIADIDIFTSVDLATMVANWGTRKPEIAQDADPETRSMFTGSGAEAADQSKVDLAENGNYLATYGVDSTRGEIQLSGSGEITGGEAKVFFDYSFTSIISPDVPIKVIVTPTSATTGQVYVAEKGVYGFVVRLANSTAPADAGVKFDWLVIARRKGFENGENVDILTSPTPTPTPEPSVEPVPTPNTTPEPSRENIEISPSPAVISEPSNSPTLSATPAPSPENIDILISPATTPEPTPSTIPEPTPSAIPEPTP